MALNQILQNGNIFECPVTSALTAGAPDIVGGFAAVAASALYQGLPCVLLTDADASDRATVACDGVFSLTVDSAGAMVVGESVYIDTDDGLLKPYSALSDSLLLFGTLLQAHGGTGEEVVKVRLNNSAVQMPVEVIA